MSSVVGIIPARYDSTRFPGKLLADLHGESVLERTWRRVGESGLLDRVIIAAADERILTAASKFGADVVDVFDECSCGSDRIELAARKLETDGFNPDIVVNIQGDEPLIEPATVDGVIRELIAKPEAGVSTAAAEINSTDDYKNPAIVKVVLDSRNYALYFSREPIPHGWDSSGGQAFRHIGIYAYRRDVLKAFTQQPPCSLEISERLEQLRLLFHGVYIAVVVVNDTGIAIDTREDLKRAVQIILTKDSYPSR